MESGYIKLYRKTLKSDMYASLTAVQRDVMMTCLMLANHTSRRWEWMGQPFECKSGQFITSLDSVRKACARGTSTQMTRTALIKLEKWGFLTNVSTKTGRLITITNWDTYQNKVTTTNKGNNRQPTDSQQTANRQLTANKNEKNYKELKELIPIPDWIPEAAWIEYVNMRQESKYPLTIQSVKLAFTKLEKLKKEGSNPKDVLDNSVLCGYRGLFATKGHNNGQVSKTPQGRSTGLADKDYHEGSF